MAIQKYILLVFIFWGFIGTNHCFAASSTPQNIVFQQEAKKSAANPNKFHSFKEKVLIAIPLKDKMNSDLMLSLLLCILLGQWGLHRIVMGGSPWLILWYVISFGGFFGVIPFLDFIRMILEPEHYQNNNKFFAAFGAM